MLIPQEISQLLAHLREAAILTSGKRLVRAIPEDPDDDFVLSAALEARADYIISGDHHLLNLRRYRGIPIVTPADFVPMLS